MPVTSSIIPALKNIFIILIINKCLWRNKCRIHQYFTQVCLDYEENDMEIKILTLGPAGNIEFEKVIDVQIEKDSKSKTFIMVHSKLYLLDVRGEIYKSGKEVNLVEINFPLSDKQENKS